jgi:chromosomal replication initiation ATPase DnaA
MQTPHLALAAGEPTDFWPRVLSVLHAELGDHRYRMWIAPLGLKSADNERVVLNCSTPFHFLNVREKFADRITALIKQFSRMDRAVDFVLDRPAPEPRDPQPLFDHAATPSPTRRTTVDAVKRYVSEKYHLQPGDLESRSRKREVVRPRQIAMYAARKLTEQSFPQIARRFGPRDHSTVLHGVYVIEQLIAKNPAFAAEIDALLRSIRDSNPG